MVLSSVLALGVGGAALAQSGGAGTAYVSNERGNSGTVIDLAADKVIATWPVGQRPRGIALSRDGTKVLVAVGTDNAVVTRCASRLKYCVAPNGRRPSDSAA